MPPQPVPRTSQPPQRPPTPQSQPPPLSRLSTSQHNPLDLKTSPVAIDKTRRGETTAASSSGYLKPLPSPDRTDPWRACLRQTGVPPPPHNRASVRLSARDRTGQGRKKPAARQSTERDRSRPRGQWNGGGIEGLETGRGPFHLPQTKDKNHRVSKIACINHRLKTGNIFIFRFISSHLGRGRSTPDSPSLLSGASRQSMQRCHAVPASSLAGFAAGCIWWC